MNWRSVCQAITFLFFLLIGCAHEGTCIIFFRRGHPVQTVDYFGGTPTQIEFLFSFKVNTTWRHISDLLMLQGLWDVSTQGRCSLLDDRRKGLCKIKMIFFFYVAAKSVCEHCNGNILSQCGFLFFLFRKITKTFITCLSDSLTWPVVVCLRAVSGVTRKIMWVIFQERQRDQENNRNV